jgi:signal recognition particle subunit SRP54
MANMFEKLTDSLTGFFSGLRGKKLTEKNIQEGLAQVRKALLEADVNVKVVRQFIDNVTTKAVGEKVIGSLRPEEQILAVVFEELVALMGPAAGPIPFSEQPPTVILMAGLQGSGKTTTCGKLAHYLMHELGKRPLLVAADVQRPAAIDQLRIVAEQVGVASHAEDGNKDVVSICKRGVAKAMAEGHDVVILDTAGRLHIDEALMAELQSVHRATRPHVVYLVCDGMVGQDAVNSAKRFNDELAIDGVILTKMDGDSRGGAALSVRQVTGKPIAFLGVGEKLDKLRPFEPEGIASRMIGHGDLRELIDNARRVIDAKEAEDLQRKMLEDEYSLEDFRNQLRQIKRMGNLKDMLSLIPGLGSQLKDLDVDDAELDRIEAIINSMTPRERMQPALLNHSRRLRVATGSGTDVRDVADLLKQFKEMRKMFKGLKKMSGIFSGALDLGSMLGLGGSPPASATRPRRGRRH